MRSLLFVPADSPKKFAKGMTSGADALVIDLEDSVAPENKARRGKGRWRSSRKRTPIRRRPYLIVRVNSLQSGLTDADLDAVAPGRPDAIMLPKAEGGPSVVHADAKLAVREAENGLPDGHIKIIPIATETAASLFVAGTYAGSSARLSALTWGAEDLSAELGAETNRDADGRYLDPYRLARTLCIAGAAAARVPAIDTVYIDFRDDAGLPPDCEAAAATASAPEWRSIRRRSRSSTRSSRRRPRRSRRPRPSSTPLPPIRAPARWRLTASWPTSRTCCGPRECWSARQLRKARTYARNSAVDQHPYAGRAALGIVAGVPWNLQSAIIRPPHCLPTFPGMRVGPAHRDQAACISLEYGEVSHVVSGDVRVRVA